MTDLFQRYLSFFLQKKIENYQKNKKSNVDLLRLFRLWRQREVSNYDDR